MELYYYPYFVDFDYGIKLCASQDDAVEYTGRDVKLGDKFASTPESDKFVGDVLNNLYGPFARVAVFYGARTPEQVYEWVWKNTQSKFTGAEDFNGRSKPMH